MSNAPSTITKEELEAALARQREQYEAELSKRADKIDKLDEELASEKNEVVRLEERVAKLQHMLWGRRSEKQPLTPNAPFQSDLFSEAPVDLPADPESPETNTQEPKSQRKTRPRKPRFGPEVEREIVDIELPESERACSSCGEERTSIGFEAAERADYIPAKIVIREERRHKYACKCKEAGIATAPTKPTAFPKSSVTNNLRAHVIVSKFADHSPYYRQSAILRRLGFEISDATMSRLGIETADRLAPIIVAMREELLASPVVQADETTIPVLGTEKAKPGAHKGWLWAYGIPRGAIVYDYTRTRAGNHPAGFLEDYEGILQVDRYEGYNSVLSREGVIDIACWAHARRRFVEAQKTSGRKTRPIIEAIQKLYAIERKAREGQLPPDARSRLRKAESSPILESLQSQLRELAVDARPTSGLGDAVLYALRHWPALTRYVEHGEAEIDNNLIENSMRPVALGRKNYLFAGSELGAEAAAILYSLTETCRRLGIHPQKYLVDVLEQLATTDATNGDQVRALTPTRWKLAQAPTS